MKTYQESLFPQKEDFNQEHFEAECARCNLVSGLSICSSSAINQLQKLLDNMDLSTSLKSSNFHYLFISEIATKFSDTDGVSVFVSKSGNKKSTIQTEGYTLIIKKNKDSSNGTIVDNNIVNQEYDKPILVVSYSIDDTWTKINSLSLSYSKAGKCIYQHIEQVEGAKLTVVNLEPLTLERVKPTLKKNIALQVVNND